MEYSLESADRIGLVLGKKDREHNGGERFGLFHPGSPLPINSDNNTIQTN